MTRKEAASATESLKRAWMICDRRLEYDNCPRLGGLVARRSKRNAILGRVMTHLQSQMRDIYLRRENT